MAIALTAPRTTQASKAAGSALVAASAFAFASLVILGKLAFASGLGLANLLSVRFLIAAALLWGLALVLRAPLPSRRTVVRGLLLGGVLYGGEVGLFFAALQRMDAGLTGFVMFTYPAMVAIGAAALGRGRLTVGRLIALAATLGGVSLVLFGGGVGSIDLIGVGLALTAAAGYAAYVLVAERVIEGQNPLVFTALVVTGAAIAFTAYGAVTGGLDPAAIGLPQLPSLLGLAIIPTVLAMTAFAAGMRKIGSASASIVASIEPAIAVFLAALLLGERLGLLQVVGAGLVVGAVLVLQIPAALAVQALVDRYPITASVLPFSPTPSEVEAERLSRAA